jgi:hypothetical protein
MSAGVARIVEITFVLKDAPSVMEDSLVRSDNDRGVEIQAFQHLPPFVSIPIPSCAVVF